MLGIQNGQLFVIDCLGCSTQNTVDWAAYQQQTFISSSSEGSRCWQSQQILAKASFPVQSGSPSPHVLTWWKGERSFRSVFYKGTNPIPEGPTLMI